MGFTLKQANPAATYAIFDLPESLLLSSTYLPTIMPGVPFHFYDDTRGVPVVRDGGVWCLPAQDLAAMPDGSIDCLINIASFQEMTPEEVRAYHDLAEHKVAGPLYSLQKCEHFTRMGEPVSGPKGNVPWWQYEERVYWQRKEPNK
jgi:putative sugar O-methyltransferase